MMTRPKVSWIRALVRYYRDPSASVLGKLVMVAAIIYAIVPVDLIPDVPIVGWLDDIGVLGLASAWLVRVVARYRTPEGLSQGSAAPHPNESLARRARGARG